jgi:hypothetical protein
MIIEPATQQTILFFIQILSLIFLIIYVVKTWEMASATRKAAEATEKSVVEMQETRDQETAPFIIAYFDIPAESKLIYFVVKNIGRTVAKQVMLTFTPELISSNNNRKFKDIGFIKNGIESMPPNYEIRTLLDTSPAYFSNKELPLKYAVDITYHGGIQTKQRKINLTLDLSANIGVSYISNKNMDNLVTEIEKLVKETREIKKATHDIVANFDNGIYISNSNILVSRIEPDMENWKRVLIAKFNEFEILWTFSYQNEREQGLNLDRLQAQFLIICNQIIIINANNMDNLSDDILKIISTIVEKIRSLTLFKFYLDGGTSLKKFNEIGDSIIVYIDEFKKGMHETS